MQPNVIYRGDCLEILHNYIPDNSVDLIYVDPPFFTKKDYEIIWGNGYEIKAYEDRWKGGIMNYISWMEPRIRECYRVLKDTGSFYLHCDWHASHRLRVLLDDIFGEENFRNEIVWHYRRWPAKEKNCQRLHDDIYFYSKKYGKNTFNQLFEPLSPGTVKAHGKAKQKAVFDEKGRRVDSLNTEEESPGSPLGDVWNISIINPMAKERLGYPTQKPEALLERIISISSNPTDIVLDPMCGCGTTIAVAQRLGRRWIGIDISPTACSLMAERMRKLKVKKIELIGMPLTIEEVKKMQPYEFQYWVCQKLMARMSKKKTGDMGIDGYLVDGTPIQVKQSEKIVRDVLDKFEAAIKRKNKKKGIIIAFSFSKGCYEEVARFKMEEGIEIVLKTVEEIIKEE